MKFLYRYLLLTIVALSFSCDSDSDPANSDLPPVPAKVNVKVKVGEYLYENLDATVKVEGFTADDKVSWSQRYDYNGDSESNIDIASGFDYYKITVSKWGLSDSQTITYQQLLKDRADGPTPTTYVFGGEIEAKKLQTVTRALQGVSGLEPYSREVFEWESGKLKTLRHSEYNTVADHWDEVRYFTLHYHDDRVSHMLGYLSGKAEPYIETTYEYYPNGNLSKIIQNNSGTGIDTMVELTYNYETNEVTAMYSLSNGNGFIYKFNLKDKNISNDITTRGGLQCSTGAYEYDRNINPFRHLGYTDIFLANLSINNKVDEELTHTACAFPELIPDYYEYQYLDHGYPTKMTTIYNTGKKGEAMFQYY